jgi:hypothetical protein
MSISIDACAAQDTIVITTRSSVYELVVIRGDRGEVFIRGGRHFEEPSAVVFLGSLADDGSLRPDTIAVGLRMTFGVGELCVVTSPVQAYSRRGAEATASGSAAAR